MMDSEKVIKAFCEDVVAVKNLNGFSKSITISESLYNDVVALLKEQETEIYKLQKELNYWQYTGIKEGW